jgi:hypothetical protein
MFDRPSYNHIQDKTGSNGALPDAEYDINCPALGMPDFKLNYLADSCEIRLSSKVKRTACSFGDGCPRFRPTVATIKTTARIQNHSKGNCVCCGVYDEIQGRGLIRVCYNRYHGLGTLHKFPLTRKRVGAKT